MPEFENEESTTVFEYTDEELEEALKPKEEAKASEEEEEVSEEEEEVAEEPETEEKETEEESATEEEEKDPWSWTEGLDPKHVEKTWSKFTQEREALIQEGSELQPLRELQQDLQNDPELARHIREYYSAQAEGVTPDQKFEKLEQRMNTMQRNVEVERELETLHVTVKTQKWPEFEDKELLKHASESRAGSLLMAYKDKFMDQILDARENKLTKEIKDNAKAGVVRKPKSAGGEGKDKPKGINDLEDMTDEEFKEYVKEG